MSSGRDSAARLLRRARLPQPRGVRWLLAPTLCTTLHGCTRAPARRGEVPEPVDEAVSPVVPDAVVAVLGRDRGHRGVLSAVAGWLQRTPRGGAEDSRRI